MRSSSSFMWNFMGKLTGLLVGVAVLALSVLAWRVTKMLGHDLVLMLWISLGCLVGLFPLAFIALFVWLTVRWLEARNLMRSHSQSPQPQIYMVPQMMHQQPALPASSTWTGSHNREFEIIGEEGQ